MVAALFVRSIMSYHPADGQAKAGTPAQHGPGTVSDTSSSPLPTWQAEAACRLVAGACCAAGQERR